MWFHDEIRADDWMLYQMESSWSGRGRALCHGHLFGHDGALLATVAQEGLVRFVPDPA
jgi:acyl-CoA thioesterase-2